MGMASVSRCTRCGRPSGCYPTRRPNSIMLDRYWGHPSIDVSGDNNAEITRAYQCNRCQGAEAREFRGIEDFEVSPHWMGPPWSQEERLRRTQHARGKGQVKPIDKGRGKHRNGEDSDEEESTKVPGDE